MQAIAIPQTQKEISRKKRDSQIWMVITIINNKHVRMIICDQRYVITYYYSTTNWTNVCSLPLPLFLRMPETERHIACHSVRRWVCSVHTLCILLRSAVTAVVVVVNSIRRLRRRHIEIIKNELFIDCSDFFWRFFAFASIQWYVCVSKASSDCFQTHKSQFKDNYRPVIKTQFRSFVFGCLISSIFRCFNVRRNLNINWSTGEKSSHIWLS